MPARISWRPTLRDLLRQKAGSGRLIRTAHPQYGYRLGEIADHLGVHAAAVSRWLRRAEQANVRLQDLTPNDLLKT